MLVRKIKTLSAVKLSSPEMYKGYSIHSQRHALAKYRKNVSVNFFLGKDFIRLDFFSRENWRL